MCMKTIAITGASGNLGGLLVEHLLQTTDWEIITFSSNDIDKWMNNPRIHQYRNASILDVFPALQVCLAGIAVGEIAVFSAVRFFGKSL